MAGDGDAGDDGWRGEVSCVGGVGRAVIGMRYGDSGVVGRVHGVGTVVGGFGR